MLGSYWTRDFQSHRQDIYHRDQVFHRIVGGGFKSNYMEEATGEDYWYGTLGGECAGIFVTLFLDSISRRFHAWASAREVCLSCGVILRNS